MRAWGLALLLALFSATGAWAQERLTIGLSQYPSTLHPNIDTMGAKSYVHGLSQRPFTAFNADWQLVCLLCTELPTFENGKAERVTLEDGTEGIRLTYTIRPEATWGDGTPITTADVLFTYEVGAHPEVGVSNAELYRRIVEIEAVDDKTFIWTGDRVTFRYNSLGDFRVLPAHIERPIFERDPANYANATAYQTDPSNPGLHFGPYRLSRLETGSFLVYERNPTWYGTAPYFDEIVVRTIENTSALEANLLAGEIDMIAGELGITLDQALAFEQRQADGYNVVYKPGLIYEHMDVMLDNEILRDLRVRQALLYGLDREAISQQLFGGRNSVALTSVAPLDWVYSEEDVASYSYDPARAKDLLDAAGWTGRTRGVRTNEAGERLSLTLMTTAGNRNRELVQQIIQAQWAQIGVEVVIDNEPPRVLFGETVQKRRFPHLALFAWISSPENVPRSTLHSEEIPSEANAWTGQNYTGYNNPEMDALIDAIEVELDRDKRAAMWHELQRIYARDLPVLPLYYRADAHIWPNWLTGITPTGHLNYSTLHVEEWRRAATE